MCTQPPLQTTSMHAWDSSLIIIISPVQAIASLPWDKSLSPCQREPTGARQAAYRHQCHGDKRRRQLPHVPASRCCLATLPGTPRRHTRLQMHCFSLQSCCRLPCGPGTSRCVAPVTPCCRKPSIASHTVSLVSCTTSEAGTTTCCCDSSCAFQHKLTMLQVYTCKGVCTSPGQLNRTGQHRSASQHISSATPSIISHTFRHRPHTSTCERRKAERLL